MNRMVRSTNPALSKDVFFKESRAQAQTETMTVEGTVNKTLLMFFLVVIGAYYSWRLFYNATDPQAGAAAVMPWVAIGGIGGFITAIITVFKKTWASATAPIYAVLEGLFLGGISALIQASTYEGIVIQAVSLTFGTLFVLLLAYKTGAIKVTKKFRTGVIAATGAVALVYFISIILQLFNVNVILFQPNAMGIGISIVIVIIAALNLVLDFDFIYQGSKAGAPKYMEWFGAFGLVLTLVWLYIEILRLLALFANRE
ncbi:MAG: Bax inhibitor-1/YccA family protein [Bacteroidales bacterium]